MKASFKNILPLVVSTLMVIPTSQALATQLSGTKLHVKTSVTEVNGVREIELGQYEKGIRKSKASLLKASVASQKKPLLDNLCVAHIAIKDFASASEYCNAAVNTGRASAISYNNRAVLNYMLGNLDASLEDLDEAAKLKSFRTLVNNNIMLVKQDSLISKR